MTAEMGSDAGALIAERYGRARELFPLLPAGVDDPAVATQQIADQLHFCESVAALDGTTLIGFLMGSERTPEPSSPMARYVPERSAVHLVFGHAVAPSADPFETYAEMFGALAPRFVDRGVIEHAVHVPLGDAAVEQAWIALGFGRFDVVAARDLSPIAIARQGNARVRRATPDDLDVVDRLVDEEAVFHAGSPIFRPYVRAQTELAVRAELAEQLASDDFAFFIGSIDGDDVGIVAVTPGFGYVRDGACYVGATAVLPDSRGGGVGAAVVAAALEWAAGQGYLRASLHFSSANRTSTRFWTGVGFVPVMIHYRRRIDERIVTHRP